MNEQQIEEIIEQHCNQSSREAHHDAAKQIWEAINAEQPASPLSSLPDWKEILMDEMVKEWGNSGKWILHARTLEAIGRAMEMFAQLSAQAAQPPAAGEAVALAPIPDWIIKYDQANHQSSAGKAIRFLMERVKQLSSTAQTKGGTE